MSREIHGRFWESAGMRFPCATHLPACGNAWFGAEEANWRDTNVLLSPRWYKCISAILVAPGQRGTNEIKNLLFRQYFQSAPNFPGIRKPI